jgi:hypothetical protein
LRVEAAERVSGGPGVVVGIPLYNRAQFLPEAIESLLGQTYPDVRLVLVDDCSADETPAIAERYAAAYPDRVHYARNAQRLALVESWRRTYELSRELHGEARYFAWGSDHDVWHPRWAAELVGELEATPAAVLAYPLSRRLSEDGEVFYQTWSFETRGITDPRERLRRTVRGMAAGSMVYGLLRAGLLERTGVFRRVLLPDRLLLPEMTLLGEFHQVPEVLWYRRFMVAVTFSRQRAALFTGSVPLSAYGPWWLTHSAALALDLGVRGAGRPEIGRARGVVNAATYLRLSARHGFGRRMRRSGAQTRAAVRNRIRQVGRVWRRAVRHARI